MTVAELNEKIIGKTLDEAQDLLRPLGYLIREHGRMGTCDAKKNRLNVSVQNGMITSIVRIG
jgi:hypothetical protein